MNETKNKDSLEIAIDNYREYSTYVVKTRSYPGIRDGCKNVARRSIHCCYKYLPRKKVKSTGAIGEIVKLHPHPNSIYDVLVGMASKYNCMFPLFETKGNFGGMGNPAAAPRYTELMLSDLAIKIFEPFADYVDMDPGEMNIAEPESLATLLPLCFLHGSTGIPTGMSTGNIPSLNPIDLIEYYMDILKAGDLSYKPKRIVRPNIGKVLISSTKEQWKQVLDSGEGKVCYKPIITISDNKKTITIEKLPPGRDFEKISKILASELARDQIDVRDETTTKERYVIEIAPYRRVNADDIIKKLDRGLTVSVTYRIILADSGVATKCGFDYAVKTNLEYTIKCCNRKLATERGILQSKLNVLKAIESMKETGKIMDLIKLDNAQAISFIKKNYNLSTEESKSVLLKPLSYLTKEHMKEITNLEKEISDNEKNSSDVYAYLFSMYKSLLSDVKRYMKSLDMEVTEFVK